MMMKEEEEERFLVSESDKQELISVEMGPAELCPVRDVVTVRLWRKLLDFDLKPQHLGGRVGWYLNAQDPKFYSRLALQAPVFTVWVIVGQVAPSPEQLYFCRRIFEEGLRIGIQVKVRNAGEFDLLASSSSGLSEILYEGEYVAAPDAVIPWRINNTGYFTIALMRQFEEMGVMVLNRHGTGSFAKDKFYTIQKLAAHGLPIPKTLVAKFPLITEVIDEHFSFPLILKKVSATEDAPKDFSKTGKGILKVESREHLGELIDMLDKSNPLIIQELIAPSLRKSLRVYVIGGRVVGSLMRLAKKESADSKTKEYSFVKIEISTPVEWLVLEAAKILSLDFARVDLLIDSDNYKICEVKSSPSLDKFEQACSSNFCEQLLKYLRLRLGASNSNTNRLRKLTLSMSVDSEHKGGVKMESPAASSKDAVIEFTESRSSSVFEEPAKRLSASILEEKTEIVGGLSSP